MSAISLLLWIPSSFLSSLWNYTSSPVELLTPQESHIHPPALALLTSTHVQHCAQIWSMEYTRQSFGNSFWLLQCPDLTPRHDKKTLTLHLLTLYPSNTTAFLSPSMPPMHWTSLRSLSWGEGTVLMLKPEEMCSCLSSQLLSATSWEGLHLRETVSSSKNGIINLFLDTSWT